MHRVILFLHVVEMSSVFVDSKFSKDILKKQEAIVVRVLYGRGVIEDADIAVHHLVVSDEEESWDVDGSFFTLYLPGRLFGEALEAGGHLAHKLIMVDVACTDYDDVFTEIVSGVEVTELVST